MLGDVFYWLFNMSIMATVTGLIVLALEKIKKLPSRLIFILWAIPFLRMWMPFGLSSKYSLMNLMTKLGTKTVVLWKEGDSSYTFGNSIGAVDRYLPVPMEYKTNVLKDIFAIASIVWITVCGLLLIGIFVTYIISKVQLRNAELLRDNIYLSEKITSPVVHGIFRKKIIIPTNYANKDLTFILAHENAHIRRRDNLWRALALITVTIHWFNPFAWLFLKHFFADLELSCDERVLRKLGEEKAKEYATALVDSAESKVLLSSSFGGAKIHRRIENILSYKRLSTVSVIFFTALASIIAYALLTNPM